MVLEPQGDSDADFELARRAVDLGWVTREQVEVALLEVELLPSSRLLSHLPLTPDQVRQLEAPAPALPPDLVQAASDPSRRVAQYILSEHQRAGGMGKVVKAWDTKLSRWVALKFLRKLGDERRRGNFEEEARLAAGLTHPNIAAIYEIGEHEGAPFIAMQFIDGRNLAEARHELKPREAARIIRDAALAVAFAHERGIIHRDLKPSNVMLDGSGRVYVMDFGLATQTDVLGTRRLPGRARTMSGTPEYASPEQARGDEADERTDVHGLGAALYDLLTGRAPNPGTSLLEILKSVEASNRVPPRNLNRRIEADLETIVLKSLDKNRSRRYPSAKDLADDLDRYLNRDPIAAHRPNIIYRLRLKLAKLKLAVTAAVTAVVLAGVLGWWVLVGSPETKHTRLYADAMNLWAEARGAAMAGRDPEGIPQRARKAREAFERAIEARDSAKAQWMKGRCLELEGRAEEALKALERAHELDPAQSDARIELAKALLLKYQISRGMPRFSHSHEGLSGIKFHIQKLPKESDRQGQVRERGEKLLVNLAAAPERKSLLKGLLAMGMGDHKQAAKDLADYWSTERWDVYALYLQGICSYFAKDLAGAVRAFDQVLGRGSHTGCFYRRGLAKTVLGLYDEAIADFDQALALDPKSAEALQCRGNAKDFKGLRDDAIADYTKAIELDPKLATAWCNRGVAQFGKGRFEDAIEDHTQAIALDPKLDIAYGNRAVAKFAKGRTDDAIADSTLAIELNPGAAVYYNDRGVAKAAKGLYDDAIEDYSKAIELDPTWARPYSNRGASKNAKKLYDEAIADCTKAIDLEPRYRNAYLNRASARESKSLFDDAISDYTKVIDLDPREKIAYRARGGLRKNKGLFHEALQDLTKVLDLDPGDAQAYGLRGSVKQSLGLHDEAIQDCSRAVTLDPNLAQAFITRGNAYFSKRVFDEALKDLTKAIELDPGSALARFNRGNVYLTCGRHDEAIADYSKAVELDPKDAWAYRNRGIAKQSKGLVDDAIEDFTSAIGADPHLAIAYMNRGTLKDLKGLKDDAISDWTRALELNPKLVEALWRRGLAYEIKGLDDEAREDYEKAIVMAPPQWPHRDQVREMLETLGAAKVMDEATKLHQLKKYREAMAQFRSVADKHPRTQRGIASTYNIACGHAVLGERKDALDWLEKAIEWGYKDIAHIEKDTDLDSLRGEERYKKLVARLKSN